MTECAHRFERTIATRVCRCGLSERFHDYMVERARGPLVERLRAAPDTESVMKRWDQISHYLLKGDRSDRPRMIFENILERNDEVREEAAAVIERLRAALKEPSDV